MGKAISFIFFISLAMRFMFFPDNVYFGFDQARDAYESQSLYKNLDIKIVGPSTAAENLFHGPLYWYLIGTFYLLGAGNPEIPAAFLLILNALGVFIIFWLGKTLFNPSVGLFAGIIYAVSFEESQYALYFGNPAPAVLTIMLFYAGLAILIFKKDWRGLPISLLFLGLSVHFEFFLIYLFVVFSIVVSVFRKTIMPQMTLQKMLLSFAVLLVSLSTFIIAEFKFGFRTTITLLEILKSAGSTKQEAFSLLIFWEKLILHINDNLVTTIKPVQILILVSIVLSAVYLIIKKKSVCEKILFLMLWFISSILLFAFGTPTLYYSNIGIAPALIIITSFFIYKIYLFKKVIALFLLVVIIISNINLVLGRNPKGIISDIYVQEGMLLSREKEILDYIYEKAVGRPVVVSALTMPLQINTTWSYLFNWYGKEKYGYLPYWAGKSALGYPGALPSWQSQEEEYTMFSIIEPTRGVRYAFIDQFLLEQKQYGEIIEEKVFGYGDYSRFVIQVRRI